MGHVFTYCGRPISYFHSSAKRSHEKAGLQHGREVKGGFIFHDLRHTFVTDCRKAGIRRSVSMSIVGHSERDMHDRYDTVDEEDKLEAIKKLEAYRQNVRQTVRQAPSLKP